MQRFRLPILICAFCALTQFYMRLVLFSLIFAPHKAHYDKGICSKCFKPKAKLNVGTGFFAGDTEYEKLAKSLKGMSDKSGKDICTGGG